MIYEERRDIFDAMKACLIFHQMIKPMFRQDVSAPSVMTQLQFTLVL